MASKASFQTKEWDLIKDGPDWVYAALAAADGKVALTTKFNESRGYSKAIDGYKTKDQLVKDVIADESKPAKAINDATLSDAEDALKQISSILDKNVDPKEADNYRDFLVHVGQAVAEAAGEKLLGIGENVSKKEASALQKIAKALKATDADKKARAQAEAKAKQEAEAKIKREAEAKAKREAEAKAKREAEAKAKAKSEAEAKAKREAEAKAKREAEAKAKKAKLEAEARVKKAKLEAEAKAKAKREAEAKAKREAEAAAAKAAKYIGEYTVVSGDSLSAIAKKFYGSTAKDKWMLIYEENKGIIGDNPNLIHPGQVYKIPKLP